METYNVGELPEVKTETKEYVKLYQLDEWEQKTLEEFLAAPKVEINYQLNDERDMFMAIQANDGSPVLTRISDCPKINGVAWPMHPGKNMVPKPVYEFIMQCPEQRRRVQGIPMLDGKPLDVRSA